MTQYAGYAFIAFAGLTLAASDSFAQKPPLHVPPAKFLQRAPLPSEETQVAPAQESSPIQSESAPLRRRFPAPIRQESVPTQYESIIQPEPAPIQQPAPVQQVHAPVEELAPVQHEAAASQQEAAPVIQIEEASPSSGAVLASHAPEVPMPAHHRIPAGHFADALVNVYNAHPQLKAEREALKAVDENVNQALSGFRPTIAGEFTKGRQRIDRDLEPWQHETVNVKALDIVQPIFRGGGTIASYGSARHRVEAGRAQLTAVEQQVLLGAVIAYSDIYQKEAVLRTAERNVDALSQQLDSAQARFEGGETTRTDTAQSEARLASGRAQVIQARGELEASRASFRRVIGYNSPQTVELPPLPAGLPTSMVQAMRWAEQAEPTLRAAEELELAAASDVNVNKAALLPTVNIAGRIERSSGGSGSVLFGPRDVDSDSLMLNVAIPFYQSGAEWSRVRASKNQAQLAKYTTIDTRNSAVENAARAWQDYMAAKAIISSSAEAVRAAEVAYEGIRAETEYGTRTVLDILNTEQDLYLAQVELINAQVAERQQAYRLLAAIGRLTAADLGLPVDIYDATEHYDDVKIQMIGF